MSVKKENKKHRTIQALVDMRNDLDGLLATLCKPCPECCPPKFPGNPGEIVDHGRGEISICEHCWGRGYMLPDDD